MVMKTSEVLSLSLSFAFGVLRLTAQHTSKAELALETLGPFLVALSNRNISQLFK